MQLAKIKSIKKLNKKFDRYDLTINKTNNFFANGILIHNTSCRIANAYVNENMGLVKKVLYNFGLYEQKKANKHLVGTRRVIIERTESGGYYGSHDMYLEVGEQLQGKLNPGEAIYGEIVGWIDEERPLFNRGGVIFKYGCIEGTRDFYVYNIKWTLPNGESIDLPWHKVKARCEELGLKHVPEVEHNMIDQHQDKFEWISSFIYGGDPDILQEIVYPLAEGPDLIDPSHIREGVVVRVDHNGGTKFLKAKSEKYLTLEDRFKSDNKIDIEESN